VGEARCYPSDHITIMRLESADYMGESFRHLIVHPDIGSTLFVTPSPPGSGNRNAGKILPPGRHGVSAALEQARIIVGACWGRPIPPAEDRFVRNKNERLGYDGAMNDDRAPLKWRKRKNLRGKPGREMSRKMLRQRFLIERAKTRFHQTAIDTEMFETKRIRLRLSAG